MAFISVSIGKLENSLKVLAKRLEKRGYHVSLDTFKSGSQRSGSLSPSYVDILVTKMFDEDNDVTMYFDRRFYANGYASIGNWEYSTAEGIGKAKAQFMEEFEKEVTALYLEAAEYEDTKAPVCSVEVQETTKETRSSDKAKSMVNKKVIDKVCVPIKHTPGEWTISMQDSNMWSIDSPEYRAPEGQQTPIAYVNPFNHDISHDQIMANARLIAAAPAMLEALKRAEGCLKIGYTTKEVYMAVIEAIKAAEHISK